MGAGMSQPPPESDVATCRCGFHRDHLMVSPKLEYTTWGWFWLTLVGASARPIKATWTCRVCGQAIDETEDPEILRSLG